MRVVGIRMRAAAFLIVVGMVSASVFGVQSVGAAGSVRGFDGTTITLAGLGAVQVFPGAQVGAEARIKRFNDTNEIKGIKLKLAEVADDKQDPATAVSEAQRLVTQVGAFAIVPEVSLTTPVDLLKQQRVPYFGAGGDASFCSEKPSTALWGFSVTGCGTPENPSFVMTQPAMYQYVSKKSGKKQPTMAILGSDDATSKNTSNIEQARAQGSGFKVVSAKNNVPSGSDVGDVTPFVQQLLVADHGSQPDSIFCMGTTFCIPVWEQLQQNGYKGAFMHALFSDALVKPMKDSALTPPIVNPVDDTPGYQRLKADLEAVKPGSSQKLDFGSLFGYGSVDMFAQALKKVAKTGKSNITPENVRKAASTMSWQLKGVMGPLQYPKSTVMPYPACAGVLVSNGTQWKTVEPYTCSTKTVSPNIKIG